VQYSTVQYSTVQYSAVQCSTEQYSTIQYSAVQYSTVQCSTEQYSTIQYSAVQCSTVQYSTVHTPVFMQSTRYSCQIIVKLEIFRQVFGKHSNIKFCRILTLSNHHIHRQRTLLCLNRADSVLYAVRTAYLHIIRVLLYFSLRKFGLNFVCPHSQFCCLLQFSHQQLSLLSSSMMTDRQTLDRRYKVYSTDVSMPILLLVRNLFTGVTKSIVPTIQSLLYQTYKVCATFVSKSIVPTLQSLCYICFKVYLQTLKVCSTDVSKSIVPQLQTLFYRRFKVYCTDATNSVLHSFQSLLYRRYKLCSTDVSKSIVPTLQTLFYRRFKVYCTDVTNSVLPTSQSLLY